MRSLTFWLFTVGCLLVAAQAFQLPDIEEPEEDILDELAEDEDVDVARMLGDLFEDEEIDEDDDDDDEEVTGRQLATVTGSEQDRYNTFMDTLLSQLKRQARRDLEPLKFTLTKPKKNNKTGKKKQRKNKPKKDKKEDKDEKSKKDKKNNKKEDKDEKKNMRNSKDVKLPEIRDIDEDLHQIQRRQAETEEEVTDSKADEDDEEIDNEKRNKNRRKNSKNKNKNKNKNNNKKQNNKKQRKSNNKVVLHGLSHITRKGDVKLYEMNKGKVLSTDFVIGPVELDVTRKIDGEEHKAAATAETLKGKLLIKINKNGNPRVKKLVLGRPTDIHTSGSIARGFGAGIGIFKKSVKQVAPTAAKKLLKAARGIIQTV